MPRTDSDWTEVIEGQSRLLDLRLRELWRYRDLVMMFVRRDFVANYKQTILGPLWFVLQPLLTSLTYILVFSRAAGLGPDGMPTLVFYLSGITIWNYFADCLVKTATVFRDNAGIFGKVYFPRLTMPVSIVLAALVKFGIQLGLFLLVWAYHAVGPAALRPSPTIVFLPVLVLFMGMTALGLGMLISSMTTKYKDLTFLLNFGVQLLMFATPVIIPLSRIPERYRDVLQWNPITPFVETFRHMFTGVGVVGWSGLGYALTFAVASLLIGTIVFNRVERTFTDTV